MRDITAKKALVRVPLVAKTVFGTRANWNKLIELESDFAEVVNERANKVHPMMPTTILTGYIGSLDPTKMVKMKVYTMASNNGSSTAQA